jgi:hypothetical protein
LLRFTRHSSRRKKRLAEFVRETVVGRWADDSDYRQVAAKGGARRLETMAIILIVRWLLTWFPHTHWAD